MKKNVKFLWWSSYKVWTVYGKTLDEIVEKCEKMCYKYHAMHFEVLD